MALKGVKVLEFAGLAPGPFCGMILSDFGASVIRIDKIGSNTDLDSLGNGKKSISLNVKHPKGVEIIKKLCKRSDVLIEPFRKGVMENLGLGPKDLLKENPKLIYARLTGFGQDGLYSPRAGHDINYVGLSGLLSLFGRKGEKPIFPVNLVADFGGGGLMCALGILLALLHRNTSGHGQIVDASMVEGSAYLGTWLYKSQNMPIWGQERGANILDTGAHFYEVYETKDNKFVTVGALEPQFYKALLEGLGLTEEEVPQFGDFNKGKEIFTKQFLTKTQKEWCDIFDNLDACVAPLLSLEEAPKNEHNLKREVFLKTSEGYIPNPAPKLSETPGTSSSLKSPPNRGQHTEELLKTLGYSKEKILDLEKNDIIECYPKTKL